MPTPDVSPHVPQPPVVILVEDHRDTSDLYGEFLNFAGYRVHSTADANEGFELAIQFGAAVVVTDYWLAGSSTGGDLCSRLKEDDRTRHIPTLLVTASSQRKQVEAALGAGCAVVRLKPYLPDAMVRDIRTLLDHQPIDRWPPEYIDRPTDDGPSPSTSRSGPTRTKHQRPRPS